MQHNQVVRPHKRARVCLSLGVSASQVDRLFMLTVSRGASLPRIISNDPATVKGLGHRRSPERGMNI